MRICCHLSNLLALSLWLTGTAQGEGFRTEQGPEDLDGIVVRDVDHENAPAVEVWMEREASASIGKVGPGYYRLSLRGRFRGVPNVRYSMSLKVTQRDAAVGGRTFWANAIPADGKFHELVTQVLVRREGDLEVGLSYRDHAREEDAKLLKEQNLAAMEKPTAEDAMAEKDDIEAEMEELPRPVGTESFLLTQIRLERLAQALAVTRVWPEKIHYFPGETANVDIEVSSISVGKTAGTLLVELLRGLDRSRELLREPVELDSGASLSRTVNLRTDEEYGYEIKATVIAEGQTEGHSLSDYFSVSESLFEVALQGWGRVGVLNDQESMRNLLNMPLEELEGLARQGALQARRRYFNMIEYFSWAPDDFFNLSPDKEVWWSGTMTYIKVKRDIKTDIRVLQTHGIKVLSYAQPFASGIDTVKELRMSPEFFSYHASGAPAVSYDYDLIKSQARVDMGLRPKGMGGGLNMFDLRTVDRGIDAVIASWKMFGWDGVRYDNRYYRANNPITFAGERATKEKDLDPYSARNVRRMKDRFWKEIGPRWLISHNNGYRFHHKGNELGWKETIKDGLMCMDEETESAAYASHAQNEWVKYMLYALEARRFCTELGGYYQLFPPARASVPTVDMVHYVVACAASGSHPITCDNEHSPAGRYGRFFTRFSAMVFARDIEPLDEPEKYLAIEEPGPGGMWWKEFANTRKAGTKRWLLFPMVVPPVHPRIMHNPASTIPPALPRVKAVLKAGSISAEPRAFLLSAEREEMCLRVELKREAVGYGLVLPRVAHFCLLVIEWEEK